MNNWLNKCHFGDCLETMRQMPSGIAQTCVTSPPYFGLRSYIPDAVKLRSDISPEEAKAVLKELEQHGVKPYNHTTE